MEIIVAGCMGMMGRTLCEEIEKTPGMRVTAGLDASPDCARFPVYLTAASLPRCDVLIDFASASAIAELLDYCGSRRTPLVVAATGHSPAQLAAIREAAQSIPIFLSPNLCMGVYVLGELAERAAACLPDYDAEIVETHHARKADSPSGTAMALAELIRESLPYDADIICGREGRRGQREIGVHSVRCGDILGEHAVIFAGGEEVLRLSHGVCSRRAYAEGALAAARFLMCKSSGLYSMKDLFEARK